MKKLILLILIVCGMSFLGFGQSFKFVVNVDVQLREKDLQDKVESYVTRELRSLGDVEISNKDPFYTIRILGLKDRTVGGRSLGYTLSTVIIWHSTCLTPSAKTVQDTYPCEIFDDHYIRSGSDDDLQDLCKDIVTNFDIRSLKPLRKK
jgi:hypothetical protein